MKNVLYALLGTIVLSSTALANWEKVPTASGDYCWDQALEHLGEHFGDEMEITYKQINAWGARDALRRFYLETNRCDGFIIIDAISRNCTRPHYYEVPNYLARVFAGGECKDLL